MVLRYRGGGGGLAEEGRGCRTSVGRGRGVDVVFFCDAVIGWVWCQGETSGVIRGWQGTRGGCVGGLDGGVSGGGVFLGWGGSCGRTGDGDLRCWWEVNRRRGQSAVWCGCCVWVGELGVNGG